MLSSAACSCLRRGGKVLARVAGSTQPGPWAGSLARPWSPWVSRPLTDAIGAGGLTGPGPRQSTSVSASYGDLSPPTDRGDGERFGALSGDIGSRRSFRKSSPEIQNQSFQEDEEDEEERRRRKPFLAKGRNTSYWYFLQCKKLLKENKLQQALDLFSGDMLKRERLQPEEYNYTILIGGCGRAGQLKKAFKLYNDMKKRSLIPTDATYTALFNACAQSPWKQAGLQHALHLEQELRRRNYPISTITYHALLKTHAVTNHLQACLHTVREMLENQHMVTQETFHYLLMGCVKEKETGFRLALQVWRQMLQSGIHPDAKNYNILLRTARDCGIGDPTTATYLLLSPDDQRGQGAAGNKSRRGRRDPIDIDLLERRLFLQPGQDGSGLLAVDRNDDKGSAHVTGAEVVPYSSAPDVEHVVVVEKVPHDSPSGQLVPVGEPPNLLDLFERKGGAMVSIGTVDGAADRLALIGRGKGFLAKMVSCGLSPDLRTLTLLADTMEPGSQSLQMLLEGAKLHKVKLDVAFFNTVIRRAAKAGDLDAAKAVLRVMYQRHVNTDVQTYGCLALACDQKKDGLQLLKDMEDARLRPNVHVFSALIGRASRRLDYIYLKTLLEQMAELRVWPNEVIIKQLEFAAQYPPSYDQFKRRNNYLIQIDGFRGYYQQWLMSMPAVQGADTEQTDGQAGTDVAPQQEQPETDGLNVKQTNQKAASRRFHYRKGSKQTSTASL
ncbi:Pentatricopeptide repeat-containing protein 1, mitochondrial [Merluccius polli]|uniref:Pentatricopeptide repeat-containing protein 1, mitochondrial n=1 Tax=Merluccius polli TaxID=89951 RepID=A0AA47NWQ8_MERPO|nr:Pentatricopeptide repeat-containing protein 1, mitochondrial [Merluccius polli]